MSNNDSLSVNDFEKICRTCLDEGKMKFLYKKSVEEVSLLEMLKSITSVEFSENDGLPVQICLNCESELNRAFKFIHKCSEVDTKLRTCFKVFKDKINNKIKLVTHHIKISSIENQTERKFQLKTEIEEQVENEKSNKNKCKTNKIFSENNENLDQDESESVSDFFPKNESNHTENEVEHFIKTEIFDKDLELSENECVENSDAESENDSNDSTVYDATHEENCYREQPTDKIEPKSPETKDLSHECKKCLEKFATRQLLWQHWREAKHPKWIQCKICSKTILSYKRKVIQHMKTHKEMPFTCEVCGKGFSLKRRLARHFMIHTGEKPYKCTVCDIGFIKPQHLEQHMRVHNEEKPHVCDYCEKQFKLKVNLDRHMKTHSGRESFKCIFCDKSYGLLPNFKQHLRQHMGENLSDLGTEQESETSQRNVTSQPTDSKPHSCQICGETFGEIGTLKSHILSHTNEKYICPVCNRVFKRDQHLENHLRTHSGEKPFLCDICGKYFRHPSTLMVHKRRHTGEKSFMCPICNKKFYDSSNMNKHRIKHGNYVFM